MHPRAKVADRVGSWVTSSLVAGIVLAGVASATRPGASVGNCSDPEKYPQNPLTHKSHPCDDFCNGRCDFNPVPPTVMTLTRMTPRGINGIANKDTGDAAGDLFFTLVSATKASECNQPNPPPWAGCFLNGDDVYIKSRVSIDGRYGIYQECNPASAPLPPAQQNEGSFACCGSLNCSSTAGPFGPIKKVNNSAYCYCDRTNRTVGRIRVVDQFANVKFLPPMLHQLASLIGGYWYSTPAEGECRGQAVPGGPDGCTWKVEEVVNVVNQSCVTDKVYSAVEQNCPAAFAGCPPPHYNRSNPCYPNAFFSSILGNATQGCPAMSRESLLDVWAHSFQGGCPNITLQ